MPPSVVKVSESKYDIQTLLKAGKAALAVDLGKPLYSSHLAINKPAHTLVLLHSMKDENCKPTAVLDDPGHLKHHFFFSFLIACDEKTLLAISSETDVKIQATPTNSYGMLAVASGSLSAWYTAITDMTSPTASYDLRAVLNRVQAILELDGFRFTDWKKVSLPDATYKLLPKS